MGNGADESRRSIDAHIHETLGELKASAEERRAQNSELFRLVRELGERCVTRDDFSELRIDLNGHMARDLTEHNEFRANMTGISRLLFDPEDDTKGLVPQVRDLEEARSSVRRLVRNAVWAAITLPPLFEALLVLWRDFIFPHFFNLHP